MSRRFGGGLIALWQFGCLIPRNPAEIACAARSRASSADWRPMRAIFDCEKCRTNAFSRRERVAAGRVRVASTHRLANFRPSSGPRPPSPGGRRTMGVATLKETQPETVSGRKTNPTAKRTQPRTASRRKTNPTRNNPSARNEANESAPRVGIGRLALSKGSKVALMWRERQPGSSTKANVPSEAFPHARSYCRSRHHVR